MIILFPAERIVIAFERCKLREFHKNAGKVSEIVETWPRVDQQARNYSAITESFGAQHYQQQQKWKWCQRLRSSFDRIFDSLYSCEWIRTFKHQAQVKFNMSTGPSNHNTYCYNEPLIYVRHSCGNLLDGQWVAHHVTVSLNLTHILFSCSIRDIRTSSCDASIPSMNAWTNAREGILFDFTRTLGLQRNVCDLKSDTVEHR